jgi:hypothetical protein
LSRDGRVAEVGKRKKPDYPWPFSKSRESGFLFSLLLSFLSPRRERGGEQEWKSDEYED